MFAKPFKLKSNNTLKNSEKKHLIQKILDEFPAASEETARLLVPAKASCSCMKLTLHSGEAADVFVSDGRPVLVAARGVLLPTVPALWLAPDLLPTITVQAPVLPKLQKGAPLYLPGVALPPGGAGLPLFARGARLAARTSDNAAAAAVGLAALASGEMLLQAGGVCMDVWHWTGDLLCREPRLARLERPRAADDATARLAAALHQCQIQPSVEAWPALGASPARPAAPAAPAEDDVEDSVMVPEDASPPAGGPAVPTAPTVPTAPDELLQWALLSFLRLQGRAVELPLKASLLYRNYLLPLCPPDRTMDVKKSSYKKVGKFLEAMQKEGLLEVRELEKGVDAVTALHAAHPRVRAHAPPAPAPPPPPPPAPAGDDDVDYTPPRVRELFSLTAAVGDVFAPLKKGTTLTASEVRTTLTEYVKSRGLTAPRGAVALDAVLAYVVNGTAQECIKWDALMAGVTARLTACTEMLFADGTRQLTKAKLEPIKMQVVNRSGNKKDQTTMPIPLQRGVRQGDVISPKLFTAALEDAFKVLDWKGRGINVNGEYISHLRFADDIVVMAETIEDLSIMLADLSRVSDRVGLKVTLVSNLEAFGFVLPELARAWQRGAAAAAAVTRAPGAKRDQLLLQGDQTYFVARTLVERYGLPKKFVEGADKALKKKKT